MSGAPFSDLSAVDRLEKARRVLLRLADKRGSPVYFFDDGFARDAIHTDAAAALAVLNETASDLAAVRQELNGQMAEVQRLSDINAKLLEALQELLRTRNAEAKAAMTYQVAHENFSDAGRERVRHGHAMRAACEAETKARALIARVTT